MESSTESTEQFLPFPRLPSELRLKVWQFALCTPRVVFITCRKSPFHHRTPEIPRTVESFGSSTPIPALLHVNREARHEALAFYCPSFVTPRSQIYVSFRYDAVRLSDSILLNLPAAALQSIRHMILDVQDCEYFEYFNMDCVRGMGVLKTLELLVQKGLYQNSASRARDADRLMEDFEWARRTYPEWECPRLRIVNKQTGEEIGLIEGGAGMYLED